MFFAESPAEGADSHQGWPVPQVRSWRRKRNYVLGATAILRPSSASPVNISPPSARPGRCASPGCRFYAHSQLSQGGGRYCCQRCCQHPGKHSKNCGRHVMEMDPPPEWALAEHGTVDIEMVLNVKLPIPTFLIPLAFCRWIIKGLVRLLYPHLLSLNECFSSTPFAERVAADARGFYRAVAATVGDLGRLSAREGEGRPRFELGYLEGLRTVPSADASS